MSDAQPSQAGTDPRVASYYASLGTLLVAWNQAENSLRQILIALCVAGPEIWILTAELGGTSLENALKSGATDIASLKLKPFISHCVEWFSRLREYRNYYVHSINDVHPHVNGKIAGVASQTTAKNRLAIHQEFILEERISELTAWISSLNDFCSDVLFHVSAHPLTEFSDGRPFPLLPEIPELPGRLRKPRQDFTADPSPPHSPEKK
jgi:hypothetical protein